MNKKLITALIAISLSMPVSAYAGITNKTEPAPSVAILDTALDTSLPAFNGKIVQEVCILIQPYCPNGKTFMEGPGAAYMSPSQINYNGFDHGTQMTSVLLSSNPNMNIVFIKIIGNAPNGTRLATSEASVYNALNWVKENASKYNIQAVTMAQGHHNLGAAGTDYCPKTPATQQSVKDLSAIGIPTFFPAGNGRDYTRLDWPACIDESVSVGYVDQAGEISANSNNDSSKLDFFALGYFSIAGPGNVVKNISGSSAAIQVAAAQYIALKQAKPSVDSNTLLSIMKSTSKSTLGRQGQFNKLIDLKSAIAYNVSATVVQQDTSAVAAANAAAAKAALVLESQKALADAEAQYQAEIKAAADKLAAIKAAWVVKLNG